MDNDSEEPTERTETEALQRVTRHGALGAHFRNCRSSDSPVDRQSPAILTSG